RIDNQLRGRAGRQCDHGSSRFYLSLEDDLLRIFGSDRISKIMLKLGMEEGVPIEAKMVTRAIENAQKKVEAHHFEIRKQLLDYDDVLNKQREVIYERRRMILGGEDLSEEVKLDAEEVLDSLREGIGLRGYGQKDPLIEYKREAFDMFAAMMDQCERDVLEHLFRVQVVQGEQAPPVQARPRRAPQLRLNRGEDAGGGNGDKTVRRTGEKVGRNDPCPCGSGKKYKKCHGA